jgi:hypothetical protein
MQMVIGEVLSALTRGLAIQCLLLALAGVILIVAGHFAHREDEPAQASSAAPAQSSV